MSAAVVAGLGCATKYPGGLLVLPVALAAFFISRAPREKIVRVIKVAAVFLLVIAIAWTPPLLNIYRQKARNKQPFRDVARAVSGNISSSDLLLVHSIPSGVLGLARYSDSRAAIASWVGQLRTRRVPKSLLALSAARKRIFFVKVHEVGEPAPEEDWLRTHAVTVAQRRFDAARVAEFHPRGAETF